MQNIVRLTVFYLTVVCALLSLSTPIYGQDDQDSTDARPTTGDANVPRRHFRRQEIAELSPTEAERIYRILENALVNGYASSGLEDLSSYQALTRQNTAPYPSASHGNHFLNNYANDIARDYDKFEQAGLFPEGSVIYKDSFAVTESRQSFSGGVSRQISLGPLFIMRKMKKGFNPVSGDWQYIEIEPDGRMLGMTNGEGADSVEYCIGCHLAREKFDHLYFIPEEYRN